MDREEFIDRLTKLRLSKNVSAREMSIASGLGDHYVNYLENGGGLPNMAGFLAICDYLGITPRDFFDFETRYSPKVSLILQEALSLTDAQQDAILNMIRAMKK